MIRRSLTLIVALVATLSLSSCLDYDEEMTINENLSGEVSVILTLPDTLISKYERIGIELDRAKIEKRLETVSGVALASYENSGGRQPKIKMVFKFTSLEKLSEAIAANPPAAIWAGKFTVTKEGGKTTVERKLGVGEPGMELPQYNTALYKTHYNGNIVATNSKQYNSPAKDVRYRYSLAELLSQQPLQSTTTEKGWPWKIILLCVAVVGAAAWYGWEYFGKKKQADALRASMPPPQPGAPAPVAAPAIPVSPAAEAPPAVAPAPSAAAPAATPAQTTPAPPAAPARPAAPQRPGPPQPRRPGPPTKG